MMPLVLSRAGLSPIHERSLGRPEASGISGSLSIIRDGHQTELSAWHRTSVVSFGPLAHRLFRSKFLAVFLLSIEKGHCPADIPGNPKARRNILFRATQAMKWEGPRRLLLAQLASLPYPPPDG